MSPRDKTDRAAAHLADSLANVVLYPLVALVYALNGWWGVLAFSVGCLIYAAGRFFLALRREIKAGSS